MCAFLIHNNSFHALNLNPTFAYLLKIDTFLNSSPQDFGLFCEYIYILNEKNVFCFHRILSSVMLEHSLTPKDKQDTSKLSFSPC